MNIFTSNYNWSLLLRDIELSKHHFWQSKTFLLLPNVSFFNEFAIS